MRRRMIREWAAWLCVLAAAGCADGTVGNVTVVDGGDPTDIGSASDLPFIVEVGDLDAGVPDAATPDTAVPDDTGDPDAAPTVCGTEGQSCCSGSACDPGLACTAGTCTASPTCGAGGQMWCIGHPMRPANPGVDRTLTPRSPSAR